MNDTNILLSSNLYFISMFVSLTPCTDGCRSYLSRRTALSADSRATCAAPSAVAASSCGSQQQLASVLHLGVRVTSAHPPSQHRSAEVL